MYTMKEIEDEFERFCKIEHTRTEPPVKVATSITRFGTGYLIKYLVDNAYHMSNYYILCNKRQSIWIARHEDNIIVPRHLC